MHSLTSTTGIVALAAGGVAIVALLSCIALAVRLRRVRADQRTVLGPNKEDLVARVRRAVEVALRAKRMSLEETRHLLRIYEDGLAGYTYLERD